jgi:hypothetical protein
VNALAFVLATAFALFDACASAQSMFRGDAAHAGAYAGVAPRQFTASNGRFQRAIASSARRCITTARSISAVTTATSTR